MPKIVISYRRADSEAITGRIRDRLVSHYGPESIFMDIDSIPFGIDFRDYIKEALAETDAVICVMGNRWLGQMPSGPSRILDETDPVRIEVETALARGIAVIPLLIDEAVMPQPTDLPDSLKNLAFRNAAIVNSGRDFHLHMDRLIRSMDKLLGRVEAVRQAQESGAPAPAQPPNIAAEGSGGPYQPAPPPNYAQPPNYSQPQQYPQHAPYRQQPPFAQPPQITAVRPVPPTKPWLKWVGIAAAVPVVIFIILAAVGFYMKRDEAKTAAPAQTAQNTPAPPPVVTPAPAPAPAPAPVPLPATPPSPPAAAAPPPTCKTDANLAFQDNFAPPAWGWDETSAARYFADGQMVFFFKDPGLLTWLYRPLRFKNATACAQIRSPMQANKLDGVASGGIVFWATDYSNYYLAQIYLNGTYQIYRRLSGEWIPVVARTASEHIRPGLGQVNELQVTTKDATGTLYINGQKLVEFRGQPPENGGSVGLHGESESDRGGEWRMLNIAVIDHDATPPKPASAKALHAATTPIACKGDKDTAFADDFKRPDAGWGDLTTTAYYEGGNMVIKPNVNRTRTVLYQSLRYSGGTVCANAKWPTEPIAADEINSGGVAFWASNYSNFYEASIYRDGTFDVYRLVADEWFAVARRTKNDAIKTAPDAVNQIKVFVTGYRATLYINDKKIMDMWGQPPPRGGAFGLFAQSDKERQNTWRFLDIAVTD